MIPVQDGDILPLTCTREGTCCHNHVIPVIPWEIAVLAQGMDLSTEGFAQQYVNAELRLVTIPEPQGWRCTFAGPAGHCQVHTTRPLPCRLFPLARRREGFAITWFYPGKEMPCLKRCPSVASLPRQTVASWRSTQDLDLHAAAHDHTGDLVAGLRLLVQRLDPAMVFPSVSLSEARTRLGPEWWNMVIAPDITVSLDEPRLWIEAHATLLINHAALDPIGASEKLSFVADVLAHSAGLLLTPQA